MEKVLSFVLISLFLVIPIGAGIQLLSEQQKLQPQAMGVTTKWTYTIGGGFGAQHYNSPFVGDLDGDGKLEVLMTGVGNNLLWCLNHNGTLRWNFVNSGTGLNAKCTVADLDNDGAFEIVINPFSNFITCLDSNGNLLWTCNVGGATYMITSWTPTVGDLDGDGHKEIIVALENGQPPYDPIISCVNSSGFLQWTYIPDCSTHSSPAIADLDGDGKLNVIFVTFGTGNVYCLDEKGTYMWNNSLEWPVGYINSSPAVGDLDGDGTLEIVVCSVQNNIYCVSNTGTLKWNTTTTGHDTTSPAIADLDGDGKLEIAVGDRSGGIICFNHTGKVRWHYPLTPSFGIESSPAIADLDNDGTFEIVVGASDNYTYCLVDNTNPLLVTTAWVIQTGYVVYSSPCIADLENDGILEILTSSFDCNLYCLGLTGVSSSGPAPWYCYHGSLFHTGQRDRDGDWLDDVSEGFYGTNPNLWDTDGDGYSDGQEVFAGTDPLNPGSFPPWPSVPITSPPVTSTVPTTSTPPTTPTTPTTTTPTTPTTTTTPTSTTTSAFISYITIFMTIVSLAAISTVALIIYRRRK